MRMGTHSYPLSFETSRTRDLAVLCVRMFAGPACPTHAVEGDDDVDAAGAADAAADDDDDDAIDPPSDLMGSRRWSPQPSHISQDLPTSPEIRPISQNLLRSPHASFFHALR